MGPGQREGRPEAQPHTDPSSKGPLGSAPPPPCPVGSGKCWAPRVWARGWERTKRPLRRLLYFPTCHSGRAVSTEGPGLCKCTGKSPTGPTPLPVWDAGTPDNMAFSGQCPAGPSMSGCVMLPQQTLQCRVCEQLQQKRSAEQIARLLGPSIDQTVLTGAPAQGGPTERRLPSTAPPLLF